MFSIFKKEINVFFSSLIGYVVIAVFLLLTGLLLWVFPDTSILSQNIASLSPLFDLAPMIFIFLIPAVTMRLFSEEQQTGTIEFLATKPLSDWAIILGKYCSGIALVVIALVPTILYFITLYFLGSPQGNIDTGATMGSYLGLIFLSSIFVAIGLYASALTNNQIVAFLLAAFLCFFVYFGFDYLSRLPFLVGNGDDLVEKMGIAFHYRSISRGIIDLSDVVYYISIAVFFLVLTKSVLDSRKF